MNDCRLVGEDTNDDIGRSPGRTVLLKVGN